MSITFLVKKNNKNNNNFYNFKTKNKTQIFLNFNKIQIHMQVQLELDKIRDNYLLKLLYNKIKIPIKFLINLMIIFKI